MQSSERKGEKMSRLGVSEKVVNDPDLLGAWSPNSRLYKRLEGHLI
jgi:hypothetical protein